MSETVKKVGQFLTESHLTIAFAESATAGQIMAEFSMNGNAGDFLKGGIVCYDAIVKEKLLNVDHALIQRYTPESMEVTRAIAEGLMQLIPADIHVGITGLTAPGGSESEDKPIGTMFFYAILHDNKLFSHREIFDGGRDEIMKATVTRCAELLRDHIPAAG